MKFKIVEAAEVRVRHYRRWGKFAEVTGILESVNWEVGQVLQLEVEGETKKERRPFVAAARQAVMRWARDTGVEYQTITFEDGGQWFLQVVVTGKREG